MGFRVLGFGVQGLGFGVLGLLGFRVFGVLAFRFQGLSDTDPAGIQPDLGLNALPFLGGGTL